MMTIVVYKIIALKNKIVESIEALTVWFNTSIYM